MLSVIYNLFVMPVQIVVETTFVLMNRLFHNKGIAIIGVSLIIQTLVLPLYKRADAMQEEERRKQEEMSGWVKHIRKTFKGDEKFMMLSTYYRQQNYKPYYGLKSSLSILLQIPFFLAAYNYLSHLEALNGIYFLFIKDLGRPDALFNIAGFDFNVLPVAMTIINIISGIIYTRKLTVRDKVQVYGLAVIFLVLLYKSPSGLVLYWTMNNIYSLCKNVFMKLIKFKKRLCKNGVVSQKITEYTEKLDWKNIVIWELIFMTILMGAMIPLSVISSSSSEFVIGDSGPQRIIIRNVCIYAGFFLVWFPIFYMLMRERTKKIFSVVLYIICVFAMFNFMGYSFSFRQISYLFMYTEDLILPAYIYWANIGALAAIAFLLVLIIGKKSKIAGAIIKISVICMAVMCIRNCFIMNKQMESYTESREHIADENILTLSKDGENVIVFMLDRAIGTYMPYLLEENESIKEMFDGFTYYPNTLSFGKSTNFCTPALFAGYEYTPENINKRDKESLKDKQNEALKVMPVLFSENGFNVVVTDPPYAGYTWDPDLSIYDGYGNIKAYITEGAYNDVPVRNGIEDGGKTLQESNCVYYSLMKIMPVLLQNFIYNDGGYCSMIKETVTPELLASIQNNSFYDWYTVLESLPDITTIEDDNKNNFIMMQNSTTHESSILSYPDYLPLRNVDKEQVIQQMEDRSIDGRTMSMDKSVGVAHYQTFAASLREIGEWMEYLKANDVYDNTRIIIVSDHGKELGQFDSLKINSELDIQAYSPLLLVKDFNSRGFNVSDEYMTNADVPTIALKDIVDNPTNPFTNKLITNIDKYNKNMKVTTSGLYNVTTNNGNVFDTSDGAWYEVTPGDITDANDWRHCE